MTAIKFSFTVLALTCATAAAELTIKTAHESSSELAAKQKLLDLVKRYDLSKWTFTTTIVIDETQIPHSHPVLTLGTGSRNSEAALLAEFIHEQSHWFEEARAGGVREAVRELEALFPTLPTTPPDGARGRFSSYMHLIVCFWELEGVAEILGEQSAQRTLEKSAGHHYRAIYRIVLDDTDRIRSVVKKHGLSIPSPGPR